MFKMRSTSHESCSSSSARCSVHPRSRYLQTGSYVTAVPNAAICYQHKLHGQNHSRVNVYYSYTARFFWSILFRDRDICFQLYRVSKLMLLTSGSCSLRRNERRYKRVSISSVIFHEPKFYVIKYFRLKLVVS